LGGRSLIYEFPDIAATIRQGDIVGGLPRIDFSLGRIPIVADNGEMEVRTWQDFAKGKEPVTAIVSLHPVFAIVASQDCDTQRAPDITLCEIRAFREVERKSKDTKSPKSWVNIITQHARINQKWFYLPPEPRLGFDEKMAVDFMLTLRVPRVDLENFRNLRIGRLNYVADEHFRERIAEFFRRYPYDEWYSLSGEELTAYRKEYPEIKPFKWQMNPQGNEEGPK
jgi:hypothetical protein